MSHQKRKHLHLEKNYFQFVEDVNVSSANKHDIVWAVLKTLSSSFSAKVPTWVAYNSLLTSAPVTTTVSMLHIINGSPALWENL